MKPGENRKNALTKRVGLMIAAALVLASVSVVGSSRPGAAAGSYQRISGEGSSWAGPAIDDMRRNVKQFGITVDYSATGSSAGRTNYLNGIVDFAASDIPFQRQPEDGSRPETPEIGSYVYIPVTAGGTAFMYNLKIAGRRVTNLRLSGENVAKIFTGVITRWNDPALAADNPGLDLPARQVVPVVRSDGSGSSAQFTEWLHLQHAGIWGAYCRKVNRAACGATSFFPPSTGMIAKNGDFGVAGQVAQSSSEGAIGYVNYSYALNNGFPVAKVLNAAGYYTEPTPQNVAVSLLKAKINTNASNPAVYLTQDLSGVYTDRDPRNYQLSSYSYFILPTKVKGQFTKEKGRTLGAFAYYAMCQAQERSASLGYSPIPINLVQAAFQQIRKIPGAEVQNINVQNCKNPTFSTDGTNTLAKNAPQPYQCDARGKFQCPFGTAGAQDQTTVKAAASGGQARLGQVAPPPAGGGGTGTQGSGTGSNNSGSGNGNSNGNTSGSGTNTGSNNSGSGNGDCEPDPETGECDTAGTEDL
ncbi:MAG TPA: phosphate ABC transporter substrate-binding protein PstS, partial [Acidimicrobiia bacterium]|nr:phosphate ABC transporter substrate-binding protein PstS [Acidimicrobiia bacterium]